jgi:hypothetical protein
VRALPIWRTEHKGATAMQPVMPTTEMLASQHLAGSSLPSMPASTFFAVETAIRIAASLLGAGAVRGEDHVIEREQRVVLERRLLLEHVQPGAGCPRHRPWAFIAPSASGSFGAR